MPRKPSPTARENLYRVHGIASLDEAISTKYLTKGFDKISTSVNGRNALLVKGIIRTEQAPWVPRLTEISGIDIDLGNSTAGALLLIQDGDTEAWALSYGIGFRLLNQTKLDRGFGMRIMLRTASSGYIQSVTRTTLDARVRTDRLSIPAGDSLLGFGIGEFGEVITRINATAKVEGLTIGDRDIRMQAADSLSLLLGKTPITLTSDLDAISRALTLSKKSELQALNQLQQVKDKETIGQLDTKLRMNLSNNVNSNEDRLALGWPFERVDKYGTPSSFKITGTNRGKINVEDGVPRLDDLIEAVKTKDPDDPLLAAKTVKVMLFRDDHGGDHMGPAIPVINWLFYETHLNSERYCFFDSKWYAMDTNYAERIKARVTDIFARSSPVQLPDWNVTKYPEELSYNRKAASDIGGTLLDSCLLRTAQSPTGFEACDIITPDGDLIHVKHVNNSTLASHLIAQAYVSTQALLHDNEAYQKLRERVGEKGGNTDLLPDRPTSVVLGIARKGGLTANSLFSFSQVTLARLDSWLKYSGIELSVVSIKRYDCQPSEGSQIEPTQDHAR